MKKIMFASLLLALGSFVYAQDDGYVQLSFTDLSGFQSQAGNWRVAGDVLMDPTVDIHHTPETTKKKKKSTPEPEAVMVQPGTGILVNLPSETQKSNILTSWTHGDILLEMDVMLPKGSNSGLYLQGRYEVQLYDSWKVKNPQFSDIGGIYRNWESDPLKSYMGKAPLTNPAKAPGLWQTLKVAFQAPRFDENGKKIANARIVKAELNGVVIHRNVEIPLPTGGPIGPGEVAEGPIMIQGDHGAVAIRNFKYKKMTDLEVTLGEVSYQAYKGSFTSLKNVENAKDQIAAGKLEAFNWQVMDLNNDFAVKYQAEITVPQTGLYTFEAFTGGEGQLKVDGTEVLNGWQNMKGQIKLTAGKHRLELAYWKQWSWGDRYLGLTIAGEATYPVKLHAFNSFQESSNTVEPIFINPQSDQPRLLRAFLDYEGKRSQRITHSIGVGAPSKYNFVYDLTNSNLVCVWKGDFVNATPMWHDRGDGSFRPLGMTQYLLNGQSFVGAALLSKGYQIDQSTGFPVFKYELAGSKVSDMIAVDETEGKFKREITLDSPFNGDFILAKCDQFGRLPNGWIVAGDHAFYIEISSETVPQIKEINGEKFMVIAVNGTQIKYSIIL